MAGDTKQFWSIVGAASAVVSLIAGGIAFAQVFGSGDSTAASSGGSSSEVAPVEVSPSRTTGSTGSSLSTPSVTEGSSAEAASLTSEAIATTIAGTSTSTSSVSVSTDGPSTALASLQYLQDIEPAKVSAFDYQTGLFSIGGVDYPNSVAWTFSNCGECVRTIEYNLGRQWSKLEVTIGVSDASRSDDRIDGTVTFTVLRDGSAGETKILSRGESASLTVDVSGVLVLQLKMGDGDNSEEAVWGDARLTR